MKNELHPSIKKVLSMDKNNFDNYIDKWEQEFVEEQGEDALEDVGEAVQSAGEPNFDQVLFDEMSKANVRIQYGKKGEDYIYHIFFKKHPEVEKMVVCECIYQSVAKLLPRDPKKIVSPPKYVYEFKNPYYIECYTLIVKGIAGKPGARRVMEDLFVKDLLNRLNTFFDIGEKDG